MCEWEYVYLYCKCLGSQLCPQRIGQCQVSFPLVRIRKNQDELGIHHRLDICRGPTKISQLQMARIFWVFKPAFWNCSQKRSWSFWLKSWVRQEAPKILTCPSCYTWMKGRSGGWVGETVCAISSGGRRHTSGSRHRVSFGLQAGVQSMETLHQYMQTSVGQVSRS